MASSLQQPPPNLEYGGNKYSQLSSRQQSIIYDELLKKCHPLQVLRAELHVLENEGRPVGVPNKPKLKLKQFVAAPNGQTSTGARRAISIGCEWGEAENHRSELLAICAIDVLTGETLIESLVAPSRPIWDWRTKHHGISPQKIDAAVQEKQCLRGWTQAREKLFEHLDRKTILVGYETGIDLRLLRLFHTTIVDSQILGISAIFGQEGGKKPSPECLMFRICRDFLGMPIQQNAFYDSGTDKVFEKALVSREIALQCIQRPNIFKKWGNKWKTELKKVPKVKNASPEKKAGQGKKAGQDKNNAKTAKTQNKAKETGAPDAHPNVETTSGPISDKSQAAGTFSQGYEAGYLAAYQAAYQAAFQSGFQTGYEKCLEKVNSQENQAMTNKLHQSQNAYEHTHQESTQHTDGEDIFDDHSGVLSQDESYDNDWAPA
ncbi:exonuclease domain-containing protein [Trichoderma breve]|uniref:Exonuclease domain-containing protein n=1 Tax=Trichoderma breve TaxID=2034170 RepID=A0A9W9E2L0_9HYPO|nr:exonuclease domain-containing protein [Trichoderma breve]KAJ4856533.1 exonuclease domain-containing protein [Trichoderma breve]